MEPRAIEVKVINSLPVDERVEYFLNRIVDNDELWSTANDVGWVKQNISGHEVVRLWPYHEFIWEGANKRGMVSFEYFKGKVLPELIKSGVDVEIFPVKDDAGKLLTATEFKKLLEEELEVEC